MRHCKGTLGLSDDAEFKLLVAFIGLESQTDHLPLGADRQFWAPEALKRADAEMARYDTSVGADLRAACQHLMDELAPSVPDWVDELDVVATLDEIVDDCYLPEGSEGTVVHVHLEPELAYMVEFCDEAGRTLALPTLLPHQVRLIWKAPLR